MIESTTPLDSQCVLNTFYVLVHFLQARPQIELHLTEPFNRYDLKDIRLHDFRLRYQLDLACLVQVIRTVYAAQHAAQHYNSWTQKWGSNSIEEFSRHGFHFGYDTTEVACMIKDGRRLLQLESACGCPYTSFVMALDWRRFEATSNDQLLQLTQDLLSKPAIQGIVKSLAPHWMYASFTWYHGSCSQCRSHSR